MFNAQISVQIDNPFQGRVDEAILAAAARATLAAIGRPNCSLSILILDDGAVQRYNRIYRQTDAPTDVLSFAVQEDAQPATGMPDDLTAELTAELGDLLLAFPYALRQAKKFGRPLAAELQLLVVHGTLHLLGYDHDTEERKTVMWRKQSEILSQLMPEDLSPRSAGRE